jgi:hypothetical protein
MTVSNVVNGALGEIQHNGIDPVETTNQWKEFRVEPNLTVPIRLTGKRMSQ